MWFLRPITKRPTRAEYSVIVIVLSGALILLGGIGLFVAFRAPANQQEAAAALYRYSSWSLALGLALASAFWAYRRFVG